MIIDRVKPCPPSAKINMYRSFSGKPSRPEGPLVVEEVRETRALCKWNKPKDDGGTDLKGYVVEKMDVDTGRWVPAGEVS